MPAPREILDLVVRFEQQLEAYQSGQYNETQLRREFLDPFFKALGWDTDNVQGFAEAYKDVIHEDQVRVGGLLKAPDYSFRIGGNRKFFLEAKKPSVAIKDEPAPAFQLRRYAWSAKLPLSVLSDFEELAIYDGRFKPHKNDPAGKARIFYCTFREYAEKWDWIYERFSREAVLKGAFDKYAESTRAKRGTSQVDDEFLATIEGWRRELAQNLALRNPKLTQRELNFAVQRIIDRIIFLRICEDRGIEDYGRLQALVNGDRIYPRLAKLFEAADDRYNSGLFHFKKEPGRHEAPDELTLELDIDDKLLRGLLRDLYYPESPYEFSVLDADILGQVYEQFLGKVIRLTEGHRAVVDDKPEVKKAGGVYYTPTYIVDYIVRQTVGKLLTDISDHLVSSRTAPPHPDPLPQGEGTATNDLRKSNASGSDPARDTFLPLPGGEGLSPRPREWERVAAGRVRAEGEKQMFVGEGGRGTLSTRSATAILNRVAKLRILDPACGSGSFLIGAYQFLLDWHLQFYLAHDPLRWAKGARPALVQTGKGWRLTIAERKRILLNNIYGVDIDSQAVEVTKLSLLLKVLEGETGQTLQTIFNLFRERALPDLGDNIKCGNSLIGPDFYQQAELPLLTDEERYRINVFDWRAEFPEIFRGSRRESAQTDSGRGKDGADSRRLLQGEGDGGFDAVIGNPPYIRIQTMKDSQPQEVKYFSQTYRAASQGNYDIYIVFVERGLQLLNNSGRQGFIIPNKFFRTDYGESLRRLLSDEKVVGKIVDFGHSQVFKATTYTCLLFLQRAKANSYEYGTSEASAKSLSGAAFAKRESKSLTARAWTFESLETASLLTKLGNRTTRLLELPADMSRGSSTGDDEIFVFEGGTLKVEKEIVREPLFASDFGRYRFSPAGKWKVIFPYVSENGEFRLYTEQELKRLFPRAYAYLHENQQGLKRRKQFKDWFGYSAPRNLALHDQAQIAVPLLADRGLFALIPSQTRGQLCPMASGGFTITLSKQCQLKAEYVLGLLNSKLLFWRLQGMSNLFRGGWITCTKQYFGELPIRTINFSDKADKAAHDRMVSLVETMLALHQQLAAARTPQERTALERQIAATDTQIDRLVYDLYGLTEDEIKIVEGAE
ncbi:MAG: N-6 DNA methylase [Verrucomicrobiae bacterium]|nr:N-6 DNA methylase [Verrucomicrobiae bacterium]